MLASRVDPILCHLIDTRISFMGFDLLLLMFPKKIWNFGLAYNSFTLPSLYLGQGRWKSISLHLSFYYLLQKIADYNIFWTLELQPAFSILFESENGRLQAEMYVWFSCRAIKLSKKRSWSFWIKFTATTWLLLPGGTSILYCQLTLHTWSLHLLARETVFLKMETFPCIT